MNLTNNQARAIASSIKRVAKEKYEKDKENWVSEIEHSVNIECTSIIEIIRTQIPNWFIEEAIGESYLELHRIKDIYIEYFGPKCLVKSLDELIDEVTIVAIDCNTIDELIGKIEPLNI